MQPTIMSSIILNDITLLKKLVKNKSNFICICHDEYNFANYEQLEIILNSVNKLNIQTVFIKLVLKDSMLNHTLEKIKLLFKYGYTIDDLYKNSITMFEFKNLFILVQLIEHNMIDPNYKNSIGITLLYNILNCRIYDEYVKYKLVELLLSHGADPNIENTYGSITIGEIPIELCDYDNDNEIRDLLIKYGSINKPYKGESDEEDEEDEEEDEEDN